MIDERKISLKQVSTKFQFIDMLTKSLGECEISTKFSKFGIANKYLKA